jgi:hypothetical protein
VKPGGRIAPMPVGAPPTRYVEFGEARVFGGAGIALHDLDEAEGERLQRFIALHEDEVRLDCSDGPVLALAAERDAMYADEFSCCGWHESRTSIGDHEFIVGSCHGH